MQVGNTYTACLWQGLASVLSRGAGGSNGGEALAGRRLLLFSFGSGTVASLLGLVARGSCGGGGDGEDGGCSDGRRQHGGDGNGVHDGGHVGGGAAAGPPKAVEGGGEGGVEGGAEGQQGLPRGPGADPRFTLSRMAEVLDLEARLQVRRRQHGRAGGRTGGWGCGLRCRCSSGGGTTRRSGGWFCCFTLAIV